MSNGVQCDEIGAALGVDLGTAVAVGGTEICSEGLAKLG